MYLELLGLNLISQKYYFHDHLEILDKINSHKFGKPNNHIREKIWKCLNGCGLVLRRTDDIELAIYASSAYSKYSGTFYTKFNCNEILMKEVMD